MGTTDQIAAVFKKTSKQQHHCFLRSKLHTRMVFMIATTTTSTTFSRRFQFMTSNNISTICKGKSFQFEQIDSFRDSKHRYKLFYHIPCQVEAQHVRVRVRKHSNDQNMYILQFEWDSVELGTVTRRETPLPAQCPIQDIQVTFCEMQISENAMKKVVQVEIPKCISSEA